ncbi:MAG: hypothetical protein ACFFD3_06055 [Candidatus Thorarchaeota archaeon]
MKRILSLLLVVLFLSGIAMVPTYFNGTRIQYVSTPELAGQQPMGQYLDSQFVDRTIKVAVYDEDNTTLPSYATGGIATNEISGVVSILTAAGHEVDTITFADILNHELLTINYDVFVMVNNIPRENITYYVKDFWLGGGGILGFGLVAGYMSYFGHLGPFYDGDFGQLGISGNPIWTYFSADDFNVSARHPVATQFHINDTISHSTEPVLLYNQDGLETNVNNPVTTVVNEGSDNGIVLAIDNDVVGGRQVLIYGNGTHMPSEFDSIIADSIDWITPRPKARIAYDLSHQPRLCVDPWDDLYATVYNSENSFTQLRSLLVNHSYTFDKFYPSAGGNFTIERLSDYDMIILDWPDLNYTDAERVVFNEWIANGGSALLLGDRSGLGGGGQGHLFLNFLLDGFDMQLSDKNILDDYNLYPSGPHPTLEGCTYLAVSYRNYINMTGESVAVWKNGTNIGVAAQNYGAGRVVLSGEMNMFDNLRLPMAANEQFALNSANWLTASTAKALVMFDSAGVAFHSNAYRGQVATALHNLGIDYMMTISYTYFNMSLHLGEWDLLIFDNINYAYEAAFPEILDYLVAHPDTRLIMDTWRYAAVAGSELWSYIGFDSGNTFSPVPETYFWDPSAPIFNIPVDLGSGPINDTVDFGWGTTATNLTVYDNATALAGFSSSQSETNVSILLGLNGRALVNGPLLDAYHSDYDDTTYIDSFEIWMNEITFMLRPFLDHPADIGFEAGSTGHDITWNPKSYTTTTGSYEVDLNGTPQGSNVWDGSGISYDADGLDPGVHFVTLTVTDEFGISESDTVIVEVVDTTPPIINSPADFTASGVIQVTWTVTDLYPGTFILYLNGTEQETDSWTSGSLVISGITGLEPGVYNLTIVVFDESGNSASDTVMVTVVPGFPIDTTTLIIIGAAIALVLIIGAIVCSRRGKAAEKATKSKKKK